VLQPFIKWFFTLRYSNLGARGLDSSRRKSVSGEIPQSSCWWLCFFINMCMPFSSATPNSESVGCSYCHSGYFENSTVQGGGGVNRNASWS